jgi:hypothetical protein
VLFAELERCLALNMARLRRDEIRWDEKTADVRVRMVYILVYVYKDGELMR